MVCRSNSGCSWPAPQPATSSSGRSRRKAMGRPSCSKVSVHRALAGSRGPSPQRDPQEDGADEHFVAEHPALPPWASGLLQGCQHGWKRPRPPVTLAVASWTMELATAPFYCQQCHVLLRDLGYALNGTRPRGESNGSTLTDDLHSRSSCFRKGEKYVIHHAV